MSKDDSVYAVVCSSDVDSCLIDLTFLCKFDVQYLNVYSKDRYYYNVVGLDQMSSYSLRQLHVNNCNAYDFSSLSNLEYLVLREFHEWEFEWFYNLEKLKYLQLSEIRYTGKSFKYIAFENLVYLHIWDAFFNFDTFYY